MIEHVAIDTRSCDQSRRIDDFEPVVGEADDFLLAKDLQCPADMNVGETHRLADVALAQRQLNNLAGLGRKPAAQPDIDLEKQMRDAFPGTPKTEVGEMIVRATFIGGDLSAEQNSKTRIGLDEGVQLTPWKGVCALPKGSGRNDTSERPVPTETPVPRPAARNPRSGRSRHRAAPTGQSSRSEQ